VKRARSRGVSMLEVLSAMSLFSIVASGVARDKGAVLYVREGRK
jgi:prepilin-type N-terminal cleavage/methylation domain-containing protein